MRYLLSLLLLLTTLTTVTFAQPTKTFYKRYFELSYGAPAHLNFAHWLAFVKKQSLDNNISPYRTLAVLETESSKNGRCLTFGPINRKGRFIGPGGLNIKCGNKKWRQKILDPYFNTIVSIEAMTRYNSFVKSMKEYNTHYDAAYIKRIRELEKKNRDAKIFDDIYLSKVYKFK